MTLSPPLNFTKLSIIIPSFNEALRLPPTLLDATDYLEAKSYDYEIIVVDDGSTDETVLVVKKMAKLRPHVRVLSLPKNLGKGAAVRAGMLEGTGEIIGFMDADGATPIAELDRLLSALNQGADVAIGSRALTSTETKIKTVWYRKLLGRIFNACVNIIAVPGIKDSQCGFKFFKREAALKIFSALTCKKFGFDVELLLLAQKNRMTIKEVPVNWVNIPGSKVNLIKDSISMFMDILKFRWIHR